MNRRSLFLFATTSALVLALFTLFGSTAMAQSCPAGSYACSDGSGCCQDGLICGTGSNGCDANRCCEPGCGSGLKSCGSACIPSDGDCCDSNGNYCAAGTYCTGDGRCATDGGGGGGGGGGSTCDLGYKSCDGQWCIPDDGQCCQNGNGNYCNAGSYCSGGGCATDDGGGGGGGGSSCPANFKSCDGQYCIPVDAQCCQNGNGNYCNAGSSCTAGGCASDSGGGCPSGYNSCGADWCIPQTNDCCGDGRYCPEGSFCDGQGGCDRDATSAPTGSGGSCDAGFVTCGAQWCMPSGADCCGDGQYCPAGSTCTANGKCASDTATSTTGSGGVNDFSSASGDGETCSSSLEGTGSCFIEFCIPNDRPCSGRYIVDGERVQCLDSCNQGSLEVCADRAVQKCFEEEDESGCQTLAGSGVATPLALVLVALLLGARQRRRA